MHLTIDEKDLQKLIVIGDKVLIKPKTQQDRTRSGLFLPPGVHEKEKIHSGYVLKVGPGFAIPGFHDGEESWNTNRQDVRYIPLQPREGDLAVYLQNSGFEIEFRNERLIIVPQSAILLLIRDEDLLK
jgi:chaperonin GroES